ncbi:MAG TPA: hypothetical protein PLM81_04390 [Ginsengibacter sp.]|nr:hypothetical protein [Ginsengibacter sp.]HRP17026.1 hypothetical protein [Ginsengibacter sp.]HRP45119.1 hypothetical protein [Ginsengibacter sp.]
MEELFDLLEKNHGFTREESQKIMTTVVTFIKGKFPMVAGAVDSLFPLQSDNGSNNTSPSHEDDSFL